MDQRTQVLRRKGTKGQPRDNRPDGTRQLLGSLLMYIDVIFLECLLHFELLRGGLRLADSWQPRNPDNFWGPMPGAGSACVTDGAIYL